MERFKKEALGKISGGDDGEGEGKIKVMVHEVFPWTKVVEAHKEMEANKNSGKVSGEDDYATSLMLMVSCISIRSSLRLPIE